MKNIFIFNPLEHKDSIPTVMHYGQYLDAICKIKDISRDEARNSYGLFTYSEWAKLFKDNTTKVRFLLEKDSDNKVFAFFPEEHYHHAQHPEYKKVFTCYAHIGQHSACHIDYANECKAATPEQYADLERELENIGYYLEILP